VTLMMLQYVPQYVQSLGGQYVQSLRGQYVQSLGTLSWEEGKSVSNYHLQILRGRRRLHMSIPAKSSY